MVGRKWFARIGPWLGWLCLVVFGWLVGWLAGWFGYSAVFVGWMVGRLVERLVIVGLCRFAGCLVGLSWF